MANTTSNLFQTLVSAGNKAAQNVSYQNILIDRIYKDYQPNEQTPGQFTTLNILIPKVTEGDATNIASGPINVTNTDHDLATLPFDTNQSISFIVKNWDQVRTPADLERLYMKPKLEALLRSINRKVANLITTTNFNSYSNVSGAGTAKWARADLLAMWNNLANAGVPVTERENMTFVTSSLAYSNTLADTSFFQQYQVGTEAMQKAIGAAYLVGQYGADVYWDQMMPQNGSAKEQGLYFHRYAIAMATRLLPKSNDPSVKETYIYPRQDLPVRVQMQYSLKDQGHIVHMNCGFGVAVVRPAFGSIGSAA